MSPRDSLDEGESDVHDMVMADSVALAAFTPEPHMIGKADAGLGNEPFE